MISDTRRDVAERLERRATETRITADAIEAGNVGGSPAEVEAHREDAALMDEAAALLREPSVGREPDTDTVEALAMALHDEWRLGNFGHDDYRPMWHESDEQVRRSYLDRARRLLRSIGTPSDSPTGEAEQLLREWLTDEVEHLGPDDATLYERTRDYLNRRASDSREREDGEPRTQAPTKHTPR